MGEELLYDGAVGIWTEVYWLQRPSFLLLASQAKGQADVGMIVLPRAKKSQNKGYVKFKIPSPLGAPETSKTSSSFPRSHTSSSSQQPHGISYRVSPPGLEL
jgi:hypothetical protein